VKKLFGIVLVVATAVILTVSFASVSGCKSETKKDTGTTTTSK
jgi:hypothetical protein